MPARPSGQERSSQVARRSSRFLAEAKNLGLRVRALREARGWTLEQANEVTGIDWKHWQKIESGQINVTLVTLIRIAEGFAEPMGTLFKQPRRSEKKP
jgi:transcriptional regulator with XRE-family HTH domain